MILKKGYISYKKAFNLIGNYLFKKSWTGYEKNLDTKPFLVEHQKDEGCSILEEEKSYFDILLESNSPKLVLLRYLQADFFDFKHDTLEKYLKSYKDIIKSANYELSESLQEFHFIDKQTANRKEELLNVIFRYVITQSFFLSNAYPSELTVYYIDISSGELSPITQKDLNKGYQTNIRFAPYQSEVIFKKGENDKETRGFLCVELEALNKLFEKNNTCCDAQYSDLTSRNISRKLEKDLNLNHLQTKEKATHIKNYVNANPNPFPDTYRKLKTSTILRHLNNDTKNHS